MHQGLGKTYDLYSLFNRLNRLYFDSSLNLEVRWSSRQALKAKRRILLGSYSPKKKQITLSRRLDSPSVPLYFVEHILFHEMLHAIFPSEKHRMHSEKFKSYERLHPDFERALAWEKSSLKILFEKPQQSLPFEINRDAYGARPKKNFLFRSVSDEF
jgi:predicted metal-dependent hydrolase